MSDPIVIVGAGQAGLAAARSVASAGLQPLVLESASQPGGSWPGYYDSLTLFSPARFSELPGRRLVGDPDHYPNRDEVIAYLRAYAGELRVDIRTDHRVVEVERVSSRPRSSRFVVRVAGGEEFHAAGVIASTGGFARPFRPELPGLDSFTGTLLHAGDYRGPLPFGDRRVVVVGAGNSAVQIGVELAGQARVTLATREPIRFASPSLLGRDLHWWLVRTGLDRLPIGPWLRSIPATPVADIGGRYSSAVRRGHPDRRAMFRSVDADSVTWQDGTTEQVDAIILATGYRPALDFLGPLGALSPDGRPLHRAGVSTTVPGLGYVGLEWQRSFGSATLRGVGRDADYVVRRLRPAWHPAARAAEAASAVRT
jgi:putative flavoprotein involved in K+ transport